MSTSSASESITGRFVVLTHDHPFLHWDLLLEEGSTLRTWRLLEAPSVPAEIAAEALPPHRLLYLDYEGPVSGNRGHVTQWDRGRYTRIEETAEHLTVRLDGDRLRSRLELVTTESGVRAIFTSPVDEPPGI